MFDRLTLCFTVGLPGSGKSSATRDLLSWFPGPLDEVSKDDLRLLPDAPQGRSRRERWVVSRQSEIIRASLGAGRSIVVHDTNFNPVHAERFAALAAEFDADLVQWDFTDVDVFECIRRDAARPAPVGESVIWQMYQRYLYVPPVSHGDVSLPRAVLVDIDGTLARMGDRSPYDWAGVGRDVPVPHVVDLVRELSSGGTQVIFMSGRDGSCRGATQEWLDEHVGVPGMLLMRSAGDSRADSLVKRELFDRFVAGRFHVRFALDDRNAVVYMWRTLGVPVLQVEYGFF